MQASSKGNTKVGRPSPTHETIVKVYSNDFATYHSDIKATKYKVHKPGCQCSKIKMIRIKNTLEDEKKLEGWIVIADSSKARSIYFHNVSIEEFTKNQMAKEEELKDIIFANHEKEKFKVSCASCVLHLQPNGFVCINSKSRSDVESVKDMALTSFNNLKKQGHEIHNGHADCLLVLNQNVLSDVNFKSLKMKGLPIHVCDMLKDQLKREGMDLDSKIIDIRIGHHLISLLRLLKKKDHFFLAIAIQGESHDGSVVFEIDLPGGKRHLGETSLECAKRETREESSLILDEKWNEKSFNLLQSKSGGEMCNIYYDIDIPTDVLLEYMSLKLSEATI